jgi:phosphatidylserine/phosphatidylglycerophosphate/cardiolipin synthase-like enzyme
MAGKADREIDHTITKNLPHLSKPGVLTARPGYEITNDQLTGKRAIVATVQTKLPLASLAPDDKLPDHLGGVPVDVREARPYQRLRAIDPLAAEVSQTYSRPEDAEPEWPLERELPGGDLLKSPRSNTQKKLSAQSKAQPAAAKALTAHQTKPNLPYDPAGCPPLTPVNATATVTTAVSPDAGLATLTQFLNGTTASLNVGMYDFTSAEILGDFKNNLASKTLQMVLDSPALNDTADQSDWQTVQDLEQALGTRANIARALTRSDHFAARWSFPYAYHIKVIVRDNSAFWLSSGNLNRSNEPDPKDLPSTEDRDWHVIIEDPGLTKTFAAYLDFDYRTAAANQAPNPDAIEKAIEEAQQKRKKETNPTSPRKPTIPAGPPVAARVFTNLSFRVTPLLTPDKTTLGGQQGQYLANIMSLINGAQATIFIQLQYIEASKGNGSHYDQLLQAIKDKITAGKDVRLIASRDYAEKWGEKMKDTGVDLTANIRTQPSVHNKGFVIDGKTVVVSSQNFSPSGIETNRDAGVILESPEIAGYFQPIFNADWGAAKQFVAKGANKPTPSNGARKAAPKKQAAKSKKQAAVKKSAVKNKKAAAKKAKKKAPA